MIKKIVFCFVVVSLIFVVAACEGIVGPDEIVLPDYNFSEDGKNESNLYFAVLNKEDAEGSATWKFITEKQGEETATITFTIKTKKYDTDKKSYMRYINGETDIAIINDSIDNYYIDNVAKTISTESGDIGGQLFGMALMSSEFGRVNFEDEAKFRWDFVSKTTATIKDVNGEDIETVQFEYNKVTTTETPLEDAVTLRLNFRKDFPVIVRTQFDVDDGEEIGTISVFITELGGTVEDTDFVIPGENEGYENISPAE